VEEPWMEARNTLEEPLLSDAGKSTYFLKIDPNQTS
jgi:hypothetical protein